MKSLICKIGTILFILVDHQSNTGLLRPLMGDIAGFSFGDGIICLLVALSTIKYQHRIWLVLHLLAAFVDCDMSVMYVHDVNNMAGKTQKFEDIEIVSYQIQIDSLSNESKITWDRYYALCDSNLYRGARSVRKKAERIDNKISQLDSLKFLVESEIDTVGGSLNHAILQTIPSKKVANIFLGCLGILSPFGLWYFGYAENQLIDDRRKNPDYIPFSEILDLLGQRINYYLVNKISIKDHDQIPTESSEFDGELLNAVTIKFFRKLFPELTQVKIGQLAGQLIDKGIIDPSIVSKVLNNNKKYKTILNRNPPKTTRCERYVQERYKQQKQIPENAIN